MISKILTTTLLCLACASAAFAGEGELAMPAWEREADARLWTQAVEEGDMPVNAYCEAGAIERMSQRRREIAREFAAALETSPESVEALVLGSLLLDFERRTITPRCGVSMSLQLGRMARGLILSHMSGIGKSGRSGPRVAAPVMATAVPGGGRQRHSGDVAVIKRMRAISSAPSRVNLVGYSLDETKADYYRLFLYRYDDIPDSAFRITSVRTPSAVDTTVFLLFTEVPQSNRTSLNTVKPIPFTRGIS